MPFTSELWNAVSPIYAAILRHPFLTGLTDGSLAREAFRFYAVQDALYLREFARALSLAAARAPRDPWIIMFNEHAAGALKVERELHEGFFADFGLTPEAVAATPLAPTNARVHELSPRRGLRRALSRGGRRAPALLLDLLGGGQGARAQGLARSALRALDRHLRLRGVRQRRARGARVRRHRRRGLGPAERDAMLRHFTTTSRYEWMFWDMGYRREAWPV